MLCILVIGFKICLLGLYIHVEVVAFKQIHNCILNGDSIAVQKWELLSCSGRPSHESQQTLRHPPEGELQACWGSYTTPVITAILDVILKPMQSDLVGYILFSCQISEL